MLLNEIKKRTILIDKCGNETEFYTELGIKQNKNTGEYYVYLDSKLKNSCEYINDDISNLDVFIRYYAENTEELQSYNL